MATETLPKPIDMIAVGWAIQLMREAVMACCGVR